MNAIKKSIELFEKGSYKKALRIFNSILNDNPLDDLIWKYKGETLAKLGNFKEAIDCYNKAIEILPVYMAEALWILKGRALNQCSEFDKAIESFVQALEINPNSEIAENEKQTAIKLKEEALKAVKEEQDAIALQVSDAFEIHQKLRSKGIQSDILHKTLYDALSNENFKEKIFDEMVKMEAERHSKKDKPKEEILVKSQNLTSNLMDQDTIEVLRNRTVQSKKANEHKSKIRQYEEEIKKKPNNSNLLSNMGNEYLGLGKYDLAIKCYNEALKLDPTKFFFKLNKGTAYLLSERYHNAAECYREALKMKPGDPNLTTLNKVATLKIIEETPVYTDSTDKEREYLNKHSQSTIDCYEKGFDALNRNRYEKALIFFDEALQIDNNYADALLQKGHIYYFRKEFKEAIRYYKKIIELNLDLPVLMLELWVNKGICHRHIREEENAIYCYKKALEINPKDFETSLNMGNILSDLDRLDEALESYNSALKLAREENFESAIILCNMGLVLVEMERYHEAIHNIDKSIEIDPVYPPSWLVKGLALKGLNKPRGAVECFNESLRINPSLSLALYEKATLLHDLGENREALVCFDNLSRINPGLISNDHKKIELIRKLVNKGRSSDHKFSEWYEKGLALIKNKEYANAILHFDKSLDIDLNNADVWVGIATAYNYLKRFEYADQCLNKALQLNPSNPEALKLRAKLVYPSFFESGIFFYLKNPIKGLKIEGDNIKDKYTRALKIFRPYLMLNNSALKIVNVQKHQIKLGITGDLGEIVALNPIHADFESFIRNLDPSLNVVFYQFVD